MSGRRGQDQQGALDRRGRHRDPGPGGHELETLGVGVLAQDLAQGHGTQPLDAVRLGLQGLDTAAQLRTGVRGDHEVPEHQPESAREVADDQRVRRQQLEHPPSEHRLGLLHRVEVEVDGVALVGHVQQVRGERAAHDEPVVLLGERVARRGTSEIAVVDVEPATLGRQLRGELAQVDQPLRIARVVGSGEGTAVDPIEDLGRVGLGGLCREGQEVDVVVAQFPLVAGHTVQVRREHRVELARRRQERVEVDRVLLVPERSGHAAIAAPFHDPPQLRSESVDGVPPGLPVTPPRGLHEQQVRAGRRELRTPELHGQRDEVGLAVEGGVRELVQDARDHQAARASGSTPDRHGGAGATARRQLLGHDGLGGGAAHASSFRFSRMIETRRGRARRAPCRVRASPRTRPTR